MESEALALNKDVLQNQRSYADLSLRLQSKEVDLEEQKRGEWERGLESWRLLRSQHTMKTFTETIRGAEFVEPEDRLGIFAEIRVEQEDVHAQIRGHVRSALRLLPPQRVSHGAVMQWIGEANLMDDWDAALTRHIERLKEQEVRQKERAMAMFADLQAAVRGYNPWPVDEQTRRLEDECLTVELERQSSVGGLIRDTEALLRFQAETWRDTCLLLGEFLRGIMARTESYYESINSLNGAADEALKTCRSTFEVLEAIDAALNHASSALRMEVARSTEAGSRITGRLQAEAADAPGGNGKTAKDRGGKPESELHLNQVTEKIVEECRSRLTKVCEDYYSAKESGREITRPDRILATVKDMKAKNEAILVKLHDQAEQHLTSAVTEVKSQVLQLSRALEKAAFVALNTLVQEIVSKVQRKCLDLSETFD